MSRFINATPHDAIPPLSFSSFLILYIGEYNIIAVPQYSIIYLPKNTVKSLPTSSNSEALRTGHREYGRAIIIFRSLCL